MWCSLLVGKSDGEVVCFCGEGGDEGVGADVVEGCGLVFESEGFGDAFEESVEWLVVEVDEVAFEFACGDLGFERRGFFLLLVELAFEAVASGVRCLLFHGYFEGAVDEGVQAAAEHGDGLYGVVLGVLEGEGEDVDDRFVVFDEYGVEGQGFKGSEEVLQGGVAAARRLPG